MKTPHRLFWIPLFLIAGFAGINPAGAQSTIDSNSTYTADFQGKHGTHTWILNLKEDFNDFRVQVESPVGELLVFLVEPGQTRGTKLQPANGKCHGAATTGVRGNLIEATLPKDKKLGPGRHIIKVSPASSKQNVNKYSVKVTEPTFSGPAPKKESAPGEVPAASASESQGELLAELRALREEVKTMREQMKAVEKRLAGLEGAQKER